MRLRTILLTLLIFAISAGYAQEEFVEPPARLITSFKFKLLTGGIITLKGRVSDFKDTLTFILDTGSGGISLDSATTERLKIKTILSKDSIRGIAAIHRVYFAYNHTLHLPGLDVDSLNFHINDYDILTSAYGEKIDGIIGFSFLSRFIVKVDYDSSKIYVYTKGALKYPRGGFLLKPLITAIPILHTDLKDNKPISYRFYFDIGAGMCLLLSADFVNDHPFY